jgi:predicted RNA-binding Zn-ribbon protein involved in translation (DUF1610 family)
MRRIRPAHGAAGRGRTTRGRLARGAKKGAEIAVAQSVEVSRIVAAALKRKEHDLEALEVGLRTAALGQAAVALGELMSSVGRASGAAVQCPGCGLSMHGTGPRSKQILTMVGEVAYMRSRYRCPHCGEVRYPADEVFNVGKTSRSPGVRSPDFSRELQKHALFLDLLGLPYGPVSTRCSREKSSPHALKVSLVSISHQPAALAAAGW